MARERDDLIVAGGSGETTTEELQRLLRAKRESITQTVEEIKMTMHSGYQDSKDKMTQTLDWRHQVEQYPLAAVAGAIAIGFLAGQMMGGSFKPNRSKRRSSGAQSRIITGSSFGAGTSLAPETRSEFADHDHDRQPHKERHFVPPALKSKFMGRVEDVLGELSDNLMNEVSRVGRDIIIPTIVTNLTSAFTAERSSTSSTRMSEARYSPKSTTEASISSTPGSAAAGGSIDSREDKPTGRFEGRGI